MRRGMTEEMVESATGPLDDAELPAATIAALRLADVITEVGAPTVTPELKAELAQHFSDGQILQLGAALSVASGWQRMIEAFDIRPDMWSAATPAIHRPEG